MVQLPTWVFVMVIIMDGALHRVGSQPTTDCRLGDGATSADDVNTEGRCPDCQLQRFLHIVLNVAQSVNDDCELTRRVIRDMADLTVDIRAIKAVTDVVNTAELSCKHEETKGLVDDLNITALIGAIEDVKATAEGVNMSELMTDIRTIGAIHGENGVALSRMIQEMEKKVRTNVIEGIKATVEGLNCNITELANDIKAAADTESLSRGLQEIKEQLNDLSNREMRICGSGRLANVAMMQDGIGTTCTASSQYNSKINCSFAMDGDIGTEWATDHQGVGAWLRIQFTHLELVRFVVIMQRLNTVEQFKDIDLKFSDGTAQRFTLARRTGSHFQDIRGRGWDSFATNPTLTAFVLIEAVSVYSTSSNGFMEVQVWANAE